MSQKLFYIRIIWGNLLPKVVSAFIHLDDLKSGGAVSFIHFNKLKDLNAYKRNLGMGKRFKLTTDKVKDIVGPDGGSLASTLLQTAKKVGAKMGKPFEKTVQVNPFTLGYDLGHDTIAPALMKAGIGPKYKGGKVTLKKVSKALQKVGKAALKTAHKKAKEIARDNKEELSAIGRDLTAAAVASATGEAGEHHFKRAVADSVNKVGHVAARDQLHKAGVFSADNPYQYGQYKPRPAAAVAYSEPHAGIPTDETIHDHIEGSGFVGSVMKTVAKHAAKPLTEAVVDQAVKTAVGGALMSQQSYGLGGKRLSTSFQTAKERMAYVRSFKIGGSMLPLGGSFAPLV